MNEIAEELPVEGTAPDLAVVERLRKICAGLSTNTHTLRDQVCDVVRQLADEMEAVLAAAHDVSAVRMPAVEALAEQLQQMPDAISLMQDAIADLTDRIMQIEQQLAPPPAAEEETTQP